MIPKLSINDGVVEILGDNGAHYLAYVVDIFDPKDIKDSGLVVNTSEETPQTPLIKLRFENNWRPKETFPLSRIRLTPKTSNHNSGKYRKNEDKHKTLTEGQEAEVWRAKKEGHECGFWKCVIKMVKDNFYGVSYGFDEQINCKIDGKEFHEIVTKEKIRPLNPNPYLTTNPFFRFLVEVPKDLLSLYPKELKRIETHRHLKTALSLIAINYDKHSNKLVCIGFAQRDKVMASERAIKIAEFMAETHFQSIKTELELRAQIHGFSQQLENCDQILKIKENEFEILVTVEDHLMRYAIGQNGSNIKKVLQMPGVLAVDRVTGVNDNIFRVIATNGKSLKLAKEALQMTELVMNIPKDLVAHIIGKKGALIQELTDKSGLTIIKIMGDEPNETPLPYVPFHLIGTKDGIENAKLLLSFQMNCIKENLEFDKKFYPKRADKRLSR